MNELIVELELKRAALRLGGGEDKIKKLKAKGKLTAWERVEYLLDDHRTYIEIAQFAGDKMYPEEGGCPNAGVVCVLGYVKDELCVIVSNDATVKSWCTVPH